MRMPDTIEITIMNQAAILNINKTIFQPTKEFSPDNFIITLSN